MNSTGLEERVTFSLAHFTHCWKRKSNSLLHLEKYRKILYCTFTYIGTEKYSHVFQESLHYSILLREIRMEVFGVFPRYEAHSHDKIRPKIPLPPPNNLITSPYTYHTETHIMQNENITP